MEFIYSTSCSMYWREFGWNNLAYFFVTPKMKIPYQQNMLVGEIAGSWSCPKIQIFWESIWRIDAAYSRSADPDGMQVTLFG